MSTISKKICLLGDFGVGKTSLIRRFVTGEFSDRYLSTVGVKISRKLVNATQSETKASIQLLIWDIEGQTKFKAIVPNYLQGAKAAIIVGDLTRQATIANIQAHINLFLSVNPTGIAIIALNKLDLISPEKSKKIQELYDFSANQSILSTYVTSAKTGEYVDEMFETIANYLV